MPIGHKTPINSERELWVTGRTAEIVVADILIRGGHRAFPAYAARPLGQAPMFRGGTPLLTPDLLICSGGSTWWGEVKAYLEPAIFKGELRHGVPQRQYESWAHLARATGLPVTLYVLEITSGVVLQIPGVHPALKCECRTCRDRQNSMPGCEVYFLREWFSDLGHCSEADWDRAMAQAEKEIGHE